MYEGRGQVVHDGRDADWTTGLYGVGTALRFDGNDYIAIPDDSSLHQQRPTVEAWVRRDGSPGRCALSSTVGRSAPAPRSISKTLHVEPAARLPEDASAWYEGTPPG